MRTYLYNRNLINAANEGSHKRKLALGFWSLAFHVNPKTEGPKPKTKFKMLGPGRALPFASGPLQGHSSYNGRPNRY